MADLRDSKLRRFVIETRTLEANSPYILFGHSEDLDVVRAVAYTQVALNRLMRVSDQQQRVEIYPFIAATPKLARLHFSGLWRADEIGIIIENFHSGSFVKLNRGVILNDVWWHSVYEFLMSVARIDTPLEEANAGPEEVEIAYAEEIKD